MSHSDSDSGRLTRSSGREMETSHHESQTQHARKQRPPQTRPQHGEEDGNGLSNVETHDLDQNTRPGPDQLWKRGSR